MHPNKPSIRTIREVTRGAIIEYIPVAVPWAGALEEPEFLGRIYDLQQ